jgi:phosphomannomutase
VDKTFNDLLDQLAVRDGVYLTDQVSIRVSDLNFITSKMKAIRTTPPEILGEDPLTDYEDLALGAHLPPTDGLRFETSRSRLIIRPSGTEPKLKCYLEVVIPVSSDGLAAAKELAQQTMTALKTTTTALLAD